MAGSAAPVGPRLRLTRRGRLVMWFGGLVLSALVVPVLVQVLT